MIRGDDEPLEDVGAFLGFFQFEARAAQHDIAAMIYEVADQIFEVHQLRPPIDKRDVVYAKRRLQRRHFIQLIEHDVGIPLALDVDHDAHAAAI